jgi:hypothetical protein
MADAEGRYRSAQPETMHGASRPIERSRARKHRVFAPDQRSPPIGSTMHSARSSPASARVNDVRRGTQPLLRSEGARLRPEAALPPPRASVAWPHECFRWTEAVLRPVEAAGPTTQGSKAAAGRRSASTGKQQIVGSRAPCPAMGHRCFTRMMRVAKPGTSSHRYLSRREGLSPRAQSLLRRSMRLSRFWFLDVTGPRARALPAR